MLLVVTAVCALMFLPAFNCPSFAGENQDARISFIQGSVSVHDTSSMRLDRPSSPLTKPTTKKGDFGRSFLSPDWMRSFSTEKKTGIKPTPLGHEELEKLEKYEIAVLIDRSGSMNENLDEFRLSEEISRWEWCRQQTTDLGRQLLPVFPQGITVIPFSDKAERIPNVSPVTISHIFERTRPNGQTMLDEAVGLELDHFLYERSCCKSRKPLLIAVITDGAPNEPQRVVEEILHVSRKVEPEELKIVFLIIGDDPMAKAFLEYIVHCRIQAGIGFDICSSYPFKQLCEQGLAKSLSNTVSKAGSK